MILEDLTFLKHILINMEVKIHTYNYLWVDKSSYEHTDTHTLRCGASSIVTGGFFLLFIFNFF